MFEMGFRDDIDAIAEYLPKSPERQTFFATATVSLAVNQAAERLMSSNREIINPTTEHDHTHSTISQYHTVVPSAVDFFPHILRLIAHSQMAIKSNKVVIFCQTTRMAQLLSTMLRALALRVLPGGEETQVFEIHSMRSQEVRTTELFNFRKLRGQPSILVTTDLVTRNNDVDNATHVIQIGIPSSGQIYFSRVGKVHHAPQGRSDLVLLPWEIGFMTWQLTEVEIKPLTLNELKREVVELATSKDAELGSKMKDALIRPSLPLIENIETEINALKSHLDEDAVKETFASLLGYYIPKSPELRCQKPIIVQGLKDWTTDACGMLAAPYVSDAFLNRLGIRDGRTKHFGEQFVDHSEKYAARREGPHWSGRGRQQSKQKNKRLPEWSTENPVLDERDPATSPEDYRTSRYGKRDISPHRSLQAPRPPPRMAWGHSGTNALGSPPASRVNTVRPNRIRTWGSGEQTASQPSTPWPAGSRSPTLVCEQGILRAEATPTPISELTPEAKTARAALSNWGNDAAASNDTTVEPPDSWQLPPAPRTGRLRWSWREQEHAGSDSKS
jgi:ATP-dependent RNA helicase MSS116, mitochondrial